MALVASSRVKRAHRNEITTVSVMYQSSWNEITTVREHIVSICILLRRMQYICNLSLTLPNTNNPNISFFYVHPYQSPILILNLYKRPYIILVLEEDPADVRITRSIAT